MTVTTVVQQHEIPSLTRSRVGMDADYGDVFTVTTERCRASGAEQWARAVVEDAAGAGGQAIWRGALQLRLSSQEPAERVGGWRIGHVEHDWIRLEATSWAMTAHLVIEVEADHVSVATLIRYDNPLGRLIWTPLSAVHRRLMPGLLRAGVQVRRVAAHALPA